MLTLPAHLTHAESSQVASWTAKAQAAAWQIDAGSLQSFDSSALSLLLELKRAAIQQGAVLQIHHAPARMTQLAGLYGVESLIA